MFWTSKTGQFDSDEIYLLEITPAGELAKMLQRSDPVVALRSLAEVMLNRNSAKLAALLADKALRERWCTSLKSDCSPGLTWAFLFPQYCYLI